MYPEPMVVECDLPTPDMLYVNHPDLGLLLIVDPRVRPEDCATMLDVIQGRLQVRPERIPRRGQPSPARSHG
jgi:hypothetical protein